jgi:hypothetical protein
MADLFAARGSVLFPYLRQHARDAATARINAGRAAAGGAMAAVDARVRDRFARRLMTLGNTPQTSAPRLASAM